MICRRIGLLYIILFDIEPIIGYVLGMLMDTMEMHVTAHRSGNRPPLKMPFILAPRLSKSLNFLVTDHHECQPCFNNRSARMNYIFRGGRFPD